MNKPEEFIQETLGKSVIIYSGWLDSTTLLYKLLDQEKDVHAMSFNYGQKHKRELEQAKEICDDLWVSHKIIDILFLNDLAPNSLTRENMDVPEGHYESETMKDTVVYNRNPIMAHIALTYALQIQANEVALWVHNGDHYIYPDCRPEAIKALQAGADIWKEEWKPDIKITAPFIHMDKAEIVARWIQLWVDYSMTHTCYNGTEIACGECGSCTERLEAFAKNNVTDPIQYAK